MMMMMMIFVIDFILVNLNFVVRFPKMAYMAPEHVETTLGYILCIERAFVGVMNELSGQDARANSVKILSEATHSVKLHHTTQTNPVSIPEQHWQCRCSPV